MAPRDVIAQSVEVRESSRIQRLPRALQALLDSTRANPVATDAARDRLLGQVLDALMAATEAHMGNIQLCDPKTQTLKIQIHRGFSPDFLQHFDSVPEGTAACGAALQRGTTVVVDDVRQSALFTPENVATLTAAGVVAVQSVALLQDDRKLGCISVHYRHNEISPRSREAFASTASLIAQIVAASQPVTARRGSTRPPN